MPKTGANTHARKRTRRAKEVHVGQPTLETRSREILAAIVEEAMTEPDGLKLPDPAAGAVSAGSEFVPQSEDVAQPVDDLATRDLVTVARHGASLEVDGAKYSSDELGLIAENVTEEAHLKISNSGGFTARELSAIAQRGPGQVIFA